ncbi:MAG: hypothetical protein ABWY05_06260 [Noviherbaspirillum sp.]
MILLTGATGAIGRATTAPLRAAKAAFKVALRVLGVPSVAFDWDRLHSYLPAWLADAVLEPNALIWQGHAATLASGVEQVLGRPRPLMREWASRFKTAAGTA